MALTISEADSMITAPASSSSKPQKGELNPDLASPYEPQTSLTLEDTQGTTVKAVILERFDGDSRTGFSNSCTVLVQAGQNEHNSLPRQFVLKIFDWRFSLQPRKRFDCETWGPKQAAMYASADLESLERFWDALSHPLTPRELDVEEIRNQIELGRLSSTMTRLDLFQYAMESNPWIGRIFFEKGLIPQRPLGVYRELFLQRFHLHTASAEIQIAHTVQQYLPGRMPRSYGIWYIRNRDVPIQGVLPAHAMEFVRGTPIVGFQPQKLNQGLVLLLMRDIETFQIQLWRCCLQIVDTNLHNFLLRADGDSQLTFRMVDYGALRMITCSPQSLGRVQFRLGMDASSEQLSMQCHTDIFRGSVERDLLKFVAEYFCLKRRDQVLDELETECFNFNFDSSKDIIAWNIIMLQILFSSDVLTVVDNAAEFLEYLIKARRIMRTALNVDVDSEPWWDRAVRQLAALFNEIDSTALQHFHSHFDEATAETFAYPFLDKDGNYWTEGRECRHLDRMEL